MKKILVIGASGMVASRFVDLANKDFEIKSCDEKTLDITNKDAIDLFFSKNKPDCVINFAAFTNVDKAESESGNTDGIVWRLNVDGPMYLAEASLRNNFHLIHVSTDFVFPGSELYPGPYSENSDLPQKQDGLGWYGWTKNRAENEVIKSGCKYSIIRYGYPFRASNYELKHDWARNLLKLYNEHNLYPLFSDQIQSILFIDDLTAPLEKIINSEKIGIFHIASNDTTTPYEAGSYLLEQYLGKHIELEKGSIKEFLSSTKHSPRPILGGLKVKYTEKELGINFRSWKQMINEFITQLKS